MHHLEFQIPMAYAVIDFGNVRLAHALYDRVTAIAKAVIHPSLSTLHNCVPLGA